MSEHCAGVQWARRSSDFTYDTYNREHDMVFKEGAIRLPASSAPAFRGHADCVDPEEAYVASLASCHMLTFLAICARKRINVESYEDRAVGILEKGTNGKLWLARVTLRPQVVFAPGATPDRRALTDLHRLAHEECFIANSVNTAITVMPGL